MVRTLSLSMMLDLCRKVVLETCDKAKCRISKEYENCDHCSEIPCQMLKNLLSNKEHGDHGTRLNNLKNRIKGKDTY